MAEDAFQNLPYPAGSKSVFQAGWPTAPDSPAHLPEVWAFVRSLRDDVNACMEKARVDKLVGANLDAEVFVHVPADQRQMLAALVHDGNHLASPRPADFNGVDDLRFLFLVSGVTLVESAEEVSQACAQYTLPLADGGSGCFVGVKKAGGAKCERCWFWSDSVGTHEGLDNVCPRCVGAVYAKGGLPIQQE